MSSDQEKVDALIKLIELSRSLVGPLAAFDGVDMASYLSKMVQKPAVNTQDVTAPTVPTGLTAVALTATSVRLTWNPSTDTETGTLGYLLLRNGVVFKDLAGATTWDDTNLVQNTAYSYSVQAYDAASPRNLSTACAPASVTTPSGGADVVAPTVPTGLIVLPLNNNQMFATWNGSTDSGTGVRDYQLFMDGNLFDTTPANQTSLLMSNVPTGAHTWTVKARDNAGTPNVSGASTGYPATTVGTSSGFTRRVNVGGPAYTDPLGNVWAADVGFLPGSSIATYGTNTPVLGADSDKATLFRTERYGQVQYQESLPDGTYNLNIYLCNHVLNQNSNLALAIIPFIKLNGTTIASNIDVWALAGEDNTYKLSLSVTVTGGTALLDFGAASFLNAIEWIATSAVAADTVPPTVPTGLVATALSDTQISLSWNASSDPGSGVKLYNVYRGGGFLGTSLTTSFTDTNLNPNTIYSYTVSATDNAPVPNTSAQSSSATATTKTPTVDLTTPHIYNRFSHNASQWAQFQTAPSGSVAFAIFNPNNFVAGPNYGLLYDDYSASDPLITTAITNAHSGGRKILGHVTAAGTSKPIAQIKAIIDTWYTTFPGLDGIFIGAAGRGATIPDGYTFVGYWSAVADYVRTKGGAGICHIHAGGANVSDQELQQLLTKYDTLIVYESYVTYTAGAIQMPDLPAWLPNYARAKFGVYANGVLQADVPALVSHFLNHGVGFLGVTAVDGDAVDTTAYFNAVVSALGQTPVTAVNPPASITATKTIDNNIQLNWPAVTGALFYDLRRKADNGAFGDFGAINIATNSYLDTTGTLGSAYTYEVRVRTATQTSVYSVDSNTVTLGSSVIGSGDGWGGAPRGVYPFLADGVTRDKTKHPFTSNSLWNTSIGDGAEWGECFIRVIPDDKYLTVIGGQKYLWIAEAGTYANYYALETFSAGGVTPQMDYTQPSTPVAYNPNGVNTQANRCAAYSGTLFNVPWNPNDWMESSASDAHAVFVLNAQGDTYEVSYAFRCRSEGGVIVSGNTSPSIGNIYGDGNYYGTHGASNKTSLGGCLRAGEMIPLSMGGRGAAMHALAIDLPLMWAHRLDHIDAGGYSYQEERVWPCDPLPNGVFAGEASLYGICFPGIQTDPNILLPDGESVLNKTRTGALIAIHPSVDIDNMGLETIPGKLFAWTMQNYGGYILDHIGGNAVMFYAEEFPEDTSGARSFAVAYSNAYGGPCRDRIDWARDNVPWYAGPGGSIGRDMDRIFRACKVVLNNAPVGVSTLASGRIGNGVGGGGNKRQLPAPA